MALVALVPTEFSITDFSKADSRIFDLFEEIKEETYPNFFGCFEKVKKEGDTTWYAIKKDMLIRDYMPLLAEFYGLFGNSLCLPPDLTKVRQVGTYDEFYETFYQDDDFNNPCLVNFGGKGRLDVWIASPKISIEQAWIFYWAVGKISCESSVCDDISVMLEPLLSEKLTVPIASALRVAFLMG